ncbi:NAD(P)/FAD-dependent oxidoreductase [Pelagibacterium halotolerans]|uniref:NADH:ubiquinone reductase (non-electrogenic) n=1 Tax=Pelagibacterium halotolerans (strain DSM 22347 / JCM 15775 / CGMCC 1.7692 / B2) TaxID=1082931 RepID=G4RBX8_PELHB|nr:NAD(P)/FAD-dependent oxidoreductase [Pelagibacterium halotolerans]AEQ50644.1 NADH dehydrogenase [Pelagibacterium halotolerans B2]QJR19420.1 NAD(P)/FAD-dependent oxidoreductase [Pelagibacterium halotolerans]SDZ91903.1 NADH dehydrogenase [Pelagibacterium halotolerans]
MAGEERVVIVGAGFGGLSAAKSLARAGVPFTIIDKRNHHLFQPLLYQVATAALSPAEIAVPIRAVLAPGKGGSIEILMEEIEGIDTARRVVRAVGGDEIAYSQLILATGSAFTYFGREDEWRPFAPALKSIDDALNIRRRVLLAFERAETTDNPDLRKRLMTFVVIGGGPTGVETAGALAELAKATLAKDFTNIDPRDTRVVLVEAVDTLLNAYPAHLGAYTERKLADLGVEVHTNSPVKRIDENGVLAGDDFIETSNIFWCAGVEATPAGKWLGLKTNKNGTVPVSRDLTIPDLPGVFVIGDAASVEGDDGKPLPALAPVAKQQGQYVAEAIIRAQQGQSPQGPFRYRDWGTMATIGRSAAVGKFGKLEVKGFPAWMLWGAVHIAYLVGFRNRINVLVNWLWNWLTYAKGARLITGPDEAATRALDNPKAVDEELDKSVNALD